MKKLLISFLVALIAGAVLIIGKRGYSEDYGISGKYYISEHLSVVRFNNGDCVIKDIATGKIVSERYWDIHTDDCADVIVVNKDRLWGYISKLTGEVIAEPQYKYAWTNGPDTHLAACVDSLDKLGFIDIRTGKTAIPHKFDYVISQYVDIGYFFHNDLCIVRQSDGECGVIDTLGNIVLPIAYEEITFLNNNLFAVSKDGNVGLLDYTRMEIILPPEYEHIYFYDAHDEYIVRIGSMGATFIDDNYSDENTCDCKWNAPRDFDVEYITAVKNDYTTLFDSEMKDVVRVSSCWDHILDLGNGYYKATRGGNNAIFDQAGNMICSF